MNKWIIGVVIAVIVLGGGYFAAKAVKHAMAPLPVAVSEKAEPTNTPILPTKAMSPAVTQDITVSGTEFAFSPSTILLHKGQQVKITFRNMGTYPHNFTVPDLDVKTTTVQPGQTASITFTPDKTGSFTYLCTVPGHADRGMTGTLAVQ